MIKIRAATEHDLKACEKLSHIDELKTPEGDYPNYRYLKEFLGKELFFVAVNNNRIIGYIAGEILNGKIVYLNCLAVESNERGKGIGTKLMTEFMKTVKDLKVNMLFFFVPTNNKQSVKFYQKHGF